MKKTTAAVLQAPGASLLARPVTPTTIIKQGSAVQTTVTATTTLQRPPVLQVTPPHILSGYLSPCERYKVIKHQTPFEFVRSICGSFTTKNGN